MLLQAFLAATLATGPRLNGLPAKAPADVGMAADRLAAIDRIIRHGINAGAFPGATVVVGREGYTVLSHGYGRLDWSPNGPVVTPDASLYDLASLTKVIATTTAVMILYDEGKLALDVPVRQYLPEFSGGLKDKATVRQLLTHHAGLPPGVVLWHRAANPSEAKQRELQVPLQCVPGACYDYSDVGADILGWIVERVTGEPLDQFVAQRVFEPLQMNDTEFRPGPDLRARAAPTADVSRRGRALKGEVNDENAYLLGGAVGHAGLFSTASDLALFAQMMLNRGELNGTRIVSAATVDLFTREQADARALGWEVGNHVHGAGELLGPHAYGHTGYTGTSLWIDPERQMFVVLLTNRVYAPHVRRGADAISDVRNDVTDAAALSITNDAHWPTLSMPVAFRSDTAQTWNRSVRPVWRAIAERRVAPRPASKPEPPKLTDAVHTTARGTATTPTATGDKTSGHPAAQTPAKKAGADSTPAKKSGTATAAGTRDATPAHKPPSGR